MYIHLRLLIASSFFLFPPEHRRGAVECLGNPAAAEDALAIVEDCRLPGRDRPRWRIEMDCGEALRLESNSAEGAGMAMPDLHPDGRIRRRRIANPMRIDHSKGALLRFARRTNHDSPMLPLDPLHEERLAGGHPPPPHPPPQEPRKRP